jgi:hypothetical protein
LKQRVARPEKAGDSLSPVRYLPWAIIQGPWSIS